MMAIKATPAVPYAPTVLAAAHRTIAGIDPNDPDLQPPVSMFVRLTERECDVLQCLANDLTQEQVAEALIISYHTVRSHIENIRGKLETRHIAGAVAIGLRTQQIQ